jgi:tripeptide aminopeptidase
LGIEVISPPVRGGTDGSRLTELGVPTPNIFTGMQNYHGPLEYVSLQDMEKATEVIVLLAQLWARQD